MKKFLLVNVGQKILHPISITTIITLSLVFFYIFRSGSGNIIFNDILTSTDRRVVDSVLRFRQPQEVSDKVGLIAVDAYSVKELGRWPWPRSLMAQIIKTLKDYYGVSVIGFDIVFSEQDQTYMAIEELIGSIPDDQLNSQSKQDMLYKLNHDMQLARTIDSYSSVVSGYFFRDNVEEAGLTQEQVDQKLEVIDPMKIPIVIYHDEMHDFIKIHEARYPEINFFADKLENNKSSGFFSITTDPDDGVIRRFEGIFKVGQEFYPAISLVMYQKYLQQQDPEGYYDFAIEFAENGLLDSINLGDISYNVDQEGTFVINFRGPQGTIKHFSFVDVLRKKYPKSELEGKLVFIGVTELGVFDIRNTPVGVSFPGLEVQGNILENLIANNFLQQNDTTQQTSIIEILLAALILLLLKKRYKGLKGDFLVLLLVASLVVVNVYLINYKNFIVSTVFPFTAIFLSWLYITLYNVVTEGREKRFIKSAFKQYLSPTVIDKLLVNPQSLQLGGETKILTMMFTDLQGFSSLSEKFDVKQLTKILNEYLTVMVDIIMAHQGTVDKFEGDAIIAFWGAPIDDPDHQRNACIAAVKMQQYMIEFRKQLAQRQQPLFHMRVGINSGEVMVGNFGSAQRMDYTIIGDAANLAARLEGVNKLYGTKTLVSDKTCKALSDKFYLRLIDKIKVLGKEESIEIFELIDFLENVTPELKWRNSAYSQALNLYRNRDWTKAQNIFTEILKTFPEDGPSQTFINRIQDYQLREPPASWDGSYRLTSK